MGLSIILRPSQPWPLCPGSPTLVANLKEEGRIPKVETDSEVAMLGTRTHSYSECRVKAMFYPEAQRGYWQEKADEIGDTLPENFLENASKYIRFVTDMLFGRENNIEWGVETKVPIWYEPNHKGTVDFWFKEGRVLNVVDYKTGRVEVSPENNTQLLSYANGLIDGRGFQPSELSEIRLGIIQPFVGGFRGHEPVWWSISPDDLLRARRELGDLAKEARTPFVRARLIPGEKQCRFCQAKALCPALELDSRKALDSGPDPFALSEAELFKVWDKAKMIREYLDAVEDRVRDFDPAVLKHNGWKLQPGARKFGWSVDESTVVESVRRLGVDPYKLVLKTPSQVRDELGDDEGLEGLYQVDQNRPSLKRMK